MGIGIVVLIIFGVVILWVMLVYNGLVTFRNRVEEAWSDIDVQMKRRYELIPNLINTVKGYAAHEAGVFQKVTEARSQAMQAGTVVEHAQSENVLTGALKSLFAVSEAYPDLKANQNFSQLQTELADTENKIQASRRFYNGNVRDYNTKIETVPTNVIAGMFSFTTREFFELDESEQEARKPVEVKF